jgi:hypothetical protein
VRSRIADKPRNPLGYQRYHSDREHLIRASVSSVCFRGRLLLLITRHFDRRARADAREMEGKQKNETKKNADLLLGDDPGILVRRGRRSVCSGMLVM